MTEKDSSIEFLTSGRLLARNTIWNLLGPSAPLVVALVATPILIGGLGKDRFGVLGLAWMVVGYFSFFDLGIGRALTRIVAERLGRERHEEIPALVWTSLMLMLVLGLVGAVVVVGLSPLLVNRLLKIPPDLQRESLIAFYVLAIGIPVVISTAGLRGLLEAHQRFGLINAVRLCMGVFTFAGPLVVLPFSRSLIAVVSVLIVGRIAEWFVSLLLCRQLMPSLRRGPTFSRGALREVIRTGSWMTVSNVLSPLMVTMDRFIIGSLISISAVTYYITPYEAVTRMSQFAVALTAVLFPAFSTVSGVDRNRTIAILGYGLKYMLIILFPVTLVVIALGREGLGIWVGSDFAENSTIVLQWLAVGIFINSLGRIAFALLQGIGRADITGKLHLIEVPFYLAALVWLIRIKGIEGAAIAWTLRIVVDTLCLFVATGRLLPESTPNLWGVLKGLVVAVCVVALFFIPMIFTIRVGVTLVILILFFFITWFYLLKEEEHVFLKSFSRDLLGRGRAAE